MDYQGNSKKDKTPEVVPDKNIERVIAGKVIIKKKGPGRKIKEIFVAADLRTVARYVLTDVIIPSAKNMIVDSGKQGLDRMVYGESAVRRRGIGQGPRITYNNPINRDYRSTPSRYGPAVSPEPRSIRYNRDDFILSSREEAETVLERMNDIIDKYEVASVADLNELVGLPSTHVDNKYGWIDLRDVQIRQIREGYLIEFPQAEAMP